MVRGRGLLLAAAASHYYACKDALLRTRWSPWKAPIFLGKGTRTSGIGEGGDGGRG